MCQWLRLCSRRKSRNLLDTRNWITKYFALTIALWTIILLPEAQRSVPLFSRSHLFSLRSNDWTPFCLFLKDGIYKVNHCLNDISKSETVAEPYSIYCSWTISSSTTWVWSYFQTAQGIDERRHRQLSMRKQPGTKGQQLMAGQGACCIKWDSLMTSRHKVPQTSPMISYHPVFCLVFPLFLKVLFLPFWTQKTLAHSSRPNLILCSFVMLSKNFQVK